MKNKVMTKAIEITGIPDTDPITRLLSLTTWREKVRAAFNLKGAEGFHVKRWTSGQSKTVYKVRSGDARFVLKETFFRGAGCKEIPGRESELILTPAQVFYEAAVFERAASLKHERKYFPAYVSADYCSYNEEDLNPVFMGAGEVRRQIETGKISGSLFITQELVEGHWPTDEELDKAAAIRARGIKRQPGLWIPVDVDRGDVIVQPRRRMVFIDAGHFTELTDKDKEVLADFMPGGVEYDPRNDDFDLGDLGDLGFGDFDISDL